MDQRANMSADLAEVLSIQEKHGANVAKEQEEQEEKIKEILEKKWARIDEIANAAVSKEKLTDNVKWLEHQVRSLTMQSKMKHNQNEADQKRLAAAKLSIETRLNKVQYAVRKAEQYKDLQATLAEQAALAKVPGASARLQSLQTQAAVLQEAIANPDPTRPATAIATDKALLAQLNTDITALELSFAAQQDATTNTHYIARSVLPRHFRKSQSKPYTLSGVSVRWVDVQDALYATSRWPEAIAHETLEVNKLKGVALLRAEDFAIEKRNEVGRIMQALYAPKEEVVVVEEESL